MRKEFFVVIVSIALFLLLINACNKNNTLILTKSKIDKHHKLDTIEIYPTRGMALLGITINHALDKFSYYYYITKKVGQQEIAYKIERDKNGWRVSKDYISTVKPFGETNWGWFSVVQGKMQNNLPNINEIIDSLKKENPECFITEQNGYIFSYIDGKVVKLINYGNIVTKYRTINFDSLTYNLYKFDGDTLVTISNNGNDLVRQKEGIYFIPKPGYGVIAKYSKQQILNTIDSMSRLSSPPEILQFKAIE